MSYGYGGFESLVGSNSLTTIYNVVGAICERSDWTLSNLQLQKLAYISQLLYIGNAKKFLFEEDFEAWDYGPVNPNLYHELKMFGSKPVQSMSYLRDAKLPDDQAEAVIDDVVKLAVENTAARLVDITHWNEGAWAKNYCPGLRGIIIPKRDIVLEYMAREEAMNEKNREKQPA